MDSTDIEAHDRAHHPIHTKVPEMALEEAGMHHENHVTIFTRLPRELRDCIYERLVKPEQTLPRQHSIRVRVKTAW
jgi:hypothetical protein